MHGVALRGQLGCPSWPAREHPSDKRRQTSATGVRNLNCMASPFVSSLVAHAGLQGNTPAIKKGRPQPQAATGVRIMQCRVLSLNASTMFNHTLKECIVGFPIA